MARASSGWVIGLWPLSESLADPPTMPTRRRPPLCPAGFPWAAGAADDPQPASTGGTAAAAAEAPIRRRTSRREKEPVAAISTYLAFHVARERRPGKFLTDASVRCEDCGPRHTGCQEAARNWRSAGNRREMDAAVESVKIVKTASPPLGLTPQATERI